MYDIMYDLVVTNNLLKCFWMYYSPAMDNKKVASVYKMCYLRAAYIC